jgi:hypothetical protein
MIGEKTAAVVKIQISKQKHSFALFGILRRLFMFALPVRASFPSIAGTTGGRGRHILDTQREIKFLVGAQVRVADEVQLEVGLLCWLGGHKVEHMLGLDVDRESGKKGRRSMKQ